MTRTLALAAASAAMVWIAGERGATPDGTSGCPVFRSSTATEGGPSEPCPFLRSHPSMTGQGVDIAEDADAPCPYSGKRGPSSIGLDEALERASEKPKNKSGTWL